MNKIIKKIFLWLGIILSGIIFLATIPVIGYYTYFMGHTILEGGMLGGDTAYHISMMRPLEEFYPKISIWFPYAGSGSSLVLGYWVFSYYIAIMGSHFFGMSSAQWIRIFEFATVPIVCIEIYIYLWIKSKNQIISTMGALLYPLSSMAWGWISKAGFYAMQLSSAFLLPQFLFYDLYLESELTNSNKIVTKRLYLLGFFLTMAFSFLVHGSIMPVLYLGLPLYTLLRTQLNPRLSEKRLISLLRGIKVLAIIIPIGVISGFYIFFPQQKYFGLQPFTPTYGVEDTPIAPWKSFLGFERNPPLLIGSLYIPLFMSLFVSVFAIVGTGIALIKRKSIAALGVTTFFYVAWLSSAKFLSATFPFLRVAILATSNRAVTITAIYITIMSAFGIWMLADLPGNLIKFVINKVFSKPDSAKILKISVRLLTFLSAATLSVLLFVWGFYYFRKYQVYPSAHGVWGEVESYPGYGTHGLSVPFCLVPGWEKEAEQPATCKDYLPKYEISPYFSERWTTEMINDAKSLDMDKYTRVAISPFLGMTVFSFTKHSDASTVAAPSGQSVINLDWLGVHDRAMFFDEGYGGQHVAAEWAKWFGTKYVFIQKGQPQKILEKYPEQLWPVTLTSGGVEVREFKQSTGIASVSNKPAILVIGKKRVSYSMTLQVAAQHGISFDNALMIEGKEKIDDYKPEELKNFSVIILRGYSYRNRRQAWDMIKKFVSDGGSLYVDTGWQFVDKDWGSGPDQDGKYLPVNLGLPSPVKTTHWGNVGTSWKNGSLGTELTAGLNLNDFPLPAWEGQPKGFAIADKKDLQDWAKPVLSVGDKVLIATGTYGKGRVVWSGMNLFAHAYDTQSPTEYALIKNIFDYLLHIDTRNVQQGKVNMSWSFPDKVEFNLTNIPSEATSYLYRAETYTPNWKAYLISGTSKKPLTIYKAGPSFQAVKIPKSLTNARIIFEYNITSQLIFSFSVSIGLLLVLLVCILDPMINKKRIELWLMQKASGHSTKIFKSLTKTVSLGKTEDEDY